MTRGESCGKMEEFRGLFFEERNLWRISLWFDNGFLWCVYVIISSFIRWLEFVDFFYNRGLDKMKLQFFTVFNNCKLHLLVEINWYIFIIYGKDFCLLLFRNIINIWTIQNHISKTFKKLSKTRIFVYFTIRNYTNKFPMVPFIVVVEFDPSGWTLKCFSDCFESRMELCFYRSFVTMSTISQIYYSETEHEMRWKTSVNNF